MPDPAMPDPVEQTTPAEDAADLIAWVRDIFAPAITRDLNTRGQLVWCPQWWDHAEAVARLWAMAMAYSSLVEEEDAPAVGASVWWVQHVDPHLAVLLNKDSGPFSQCVREHRSGTGLPWQEPPAGLVLPTIVGPQDAGVLAATVDHP